jgi:hypothetical protein
MSHTHIPGRAGSEIGVAGRTPMISVVIPVFSGGVLAVRPH